ncbi:MAG: hypothetical protein GXP29_11505 [Planctomycetes bacterium]|nr:hypothetical protein [Planctomycetota bacterium]
MSRITMRMMGCMMMVLAMAASGCQQPTAGGDLSNLTDANNNGFDDVAPPDGVAFDEATNAKVRLVNTINGQDVAQLAEQQGIDPGLLNFVAIDVEIVLTLNYNNFESIVLRQNEALEPFSRSFEAACPDSLSVEVSVTANVPIVGPQSIFNQVFELAVGVDYECGETLSVETFADDNGNPQVNVSSS